jgi:hypothetical protein
MAKSKSTKRELVEIEEPSEPKQEFKRRAKIQKVKAMAEDELMTDAGIEPSHHGLVSPTSPPGRTNHLIPGNQGMQPRSPLLLILVLKLMLTSIPIKITPWGMKLDALTDQLLPPFA